MAIRGLLAGLLGLALILLPASLRAQAQPVRCVLFTHIEDNTPGGLLGSPQCEQNYLTYRGRLIEVAELFYDYSVPWSLQPDWKLLEAALIYEDSTLMATTNGKNFLRYLKEDLGVVIDPHSHEGFGYNYTDVAHLIDSLQIGTTTVIGGHVWDPDLPEFQEWDRFRVPVTGEHYPWALWRGDILMGSGTPNHVNDPVVSGVWQPRDRYHYFEHDSTANIAAVGQYKGTIEDILELVELYESGDVPPEYMLTSSYGVRPATIMRPDGLVAIEDSVIAPVVAMRDSGLIVLTDFTSLIETWQTTFDSRGFLYDANATTGVEAGPTGSALSFARCAPNPFTTATTIRFSVSRPAWVRLAVFDAAGREVALLADEMMPAGTRHVLLDAERMASGTYFYRLDERALTGSGSASTSGHSTGKLVLIR